MCIHDSLRLSLHKGPTNSTVLGKPVWDLTSPICTPNKFEAASNPLLTQDLLHNDLNALQPVFTQKCLHILFIVHTVAHWWMRDLDDVIIK
jgi:hypothetical protein